MAENLQFNLEVNNSKAIQSIDEFFNKFQAGAKEARSTLDQTLGTKGKIEVVIETKGGQKVKNSVKGISQEAKKFKENYKLANGELGKTAAHVKKQINALKELRDNTEKFNRATGKLNQTWSKYNKKLQIAKDTFRTLNFEGPINALKNALSGVVLQFTTVQTLKDGLIGGFRMLTDAIRNVAVSAMEMQVLSLQLEAFTGSAEGARQAFEAFGATAAATPFDLKQVAQAGKTMMAFGMSTADSTEMTDRLAIAAAATGGELNNLGRNLGQIQAQGRAYTRDLTQFAMQGIPIWEELSEVTGKSVVELKAMAKDGLIGFDEVSQAIRNMTDEGSAFAEIAERMGETVQGKLAQIEQAQDKVALAFSKSFEKIERVIPLVKTALDVVKNFFEFIANNSDNIIALLGTIGIMLGLLAAPKIIGGIAALFGGLSKVVGMVSGLFKGVGLLTGGFLLLKAAIPIAIFFALKGAMKSAEQAAKDKAQADYVALDASDRLKESELKKAAQFRTNIGVAATYALALREIADAAEEALDKEVAELNKIAAKRQEEHDKRMEEIDEQVEAKQNQINDEKAAHRDLMDQKRQDHEEEMKQLQDVYDKKIEAIDLDIENLQKRTPEEQKLYDLQKKQLEDKIKYDKLDEMEMARAKARLSRMNRREQIEEERLEKKKLEKQRDDEILALQRKQKEEIDEMNEKHNDRIKALEDQITALKNQKTVAEEAFEKEKAEIDKINAKHQDMKESIDTSTAALQAQMDKVKLLTQEYEKLRSKARDAEIQLNREADAEDRLNRQKSGRSKNRQRASGGPVTGGSTYTVNELGKEAFLSAQGRLSMINAPSWGQWTAPGKGTVIPAHLTSQLNIPTGGINLNKAASGNAMMANSNQGTGSIVKAIKSAMSGGDNITNNVTVQSDNTTKTASDMLVSMTRLRRRRYS